MEFSHYVFCVQLRSSLVWDLVQCRSVVLFTDVSDRIIGRISTGRVVQEEGYSTLEDGTGRLSLNVGNVLLCVKSPRSEEIIYTTAEVCNHALYTVNSQDDIRD
jgi:hypothetical protein